MNFRTQIPVWEHLDIVLNESAKIHVADPANIRNVIW